MPLSDLIRTLNKPSDSFPKHYAISGLDQPFVAKDGKVFLHYANIRIESKFLPIIETTTGNLYGHAASIQAFGLTNGIQMAPEAVFVLPSDDEEFVYLDRLVRTLHALNYLTKPSRGNLLLNVHPRHVLSVPAHHGLAFEEILRPCGLFPEQITLEINTDRIDDTDHLIRAIASYRSRGYGIAVSHFGHSRLDFGLLRELQPSLVKLDPLLLGSSRPLNRIIDCLHKLPSKVMIEGTDSLSLRKIANATEIDLVQTNQRRLLQAPQLLGGKNSWSADRNAA